MHFSKIATVLSFAALALAAPAPEAAPADGLVTRSTCPPPNGCKKSGKYYKIGPTCPVGDSYRCSTTAVIAIINCVNVLTNIAVDVDIKDVVDIKF
ncbi:hypothetical protein EPUS_07325 [Endocarpon pusillum Z07020]|uniref:Uncharacterized protein n=1 Tax=Endocarpon pusillum (strain Z07020 / HMAS-L-300199) TaxID=1263415 RepID=U1HZT4_ENDPU|nr:uncharacterized protein EPUS_07325 [Endocarpon pusillum Z07020]ERF76445.1 hypothetical protein EPUS_07325 [Endocarpon pusillum Z07020]